MLGQIEASRFRDGRDTCAKALIADGRSEINCTSDGKRTFRSCGQRPRDKTCRHGRATGSGVCEIRWSSAQRSRQVCKLRCNRQRSWWIVEHKNWSTCYHTHTHTNAGERSASVIETSVQARAPYGQDGPRNLIKRELNCCRCLRSGLAEPRLVILSVRVLILTNVGDSDKRRPHPV